MYGKCSFAILSADGTHTYHDFKNLLEQGQGKCFVSSREFAVKKYAILFLRPGCIPEKVGVYKKGVNQK